MNMSRFISSVCIVGLLTACTVDTAETGVAASANASAPVTAPEPVSAAAPAETWRGDLRAEFEQEFFDYYLDIKIARTLAAFCRPVIFRERTYERDVRDFAIGLRDRGLGWADLRWLEDNLSTEDHDRAAYQWLAANGLGARDEPEEKFCAVAQQEIAADSDVGKWLTQ